MSADTGTSDVSPYYVPELTQSSFIDKTTSMSDSVLLEISDNMSLSFKESAKLTIIIMFMYHIHNVLYDT